jgi:hypothetical protein
MKEKANRPVLAMNFYELGTNSTNRGSINPFSGGQPYCNMVKLAREERELK